MASPPPLAKPLAMEPVEVRLRRLEDTLVKFPPEHRMECTKRAPWQECTCGLDSVLLQLRGEGRG